MAHVSSQYQTAIFDGTISKSVTAGNWLFIAIWTADSPEGPVTGATDDHSNTWFIDRAIVTATNSRRLTLLRAKNLVTGTVTVTVNVTGTHDVARICLSEFDDVLDDSPLDASAGADDSGASATVYDSGAGGTTAKADNLLIGIVGSDFTGPIISVDSPWTKHVPGATSERIALVSRTTYAVGNYSLTGTFDAAEAWGAGFCVYKLPSDKSTGLMNPRNVLRPAMFAPGIAR